MKQKDLPGVVSNQQLVTQEFLSPVVFPEASLTPDNLSTVLDIMSDRLWKTFGGYANIPDSELERIKAQCTSDRECKQALIHSFISSHPAPSWTLVAWALYMTERAKEDGSCLRALHHLQQLFPTGTVNFLGWLTLPSTCTLYSHTPDPLLCHGTIYRCSLHLVLLLTSSDTHLTLGLGCEIGEGEGRNRENGW